MSGTPAIAPPQRPAAVERRSGPIGFTVSLLAHLLLMGMLITGGELFRGEDLGAIAVAEVTLISVSQFGALDPQRPELPVEAPPTPPQVRADPPPEAPPTALPRPPPAPAPAVQPPQPPDRPAERRPLLVPAEPAPAQVAFAVPEPTPSPDSPPPPPQAPPEPTPPPPPVPVSRPEPPPDTSEETIAALESLLEQDLSAQQTPQDTIASLAEQVEQLSQESAQAPRRLSGQRGALSDREYAYMRDRLAECWTVSGILGARNAAQLRVTVLVELSKDGLLVGAPELVSPKPLPSVEHEHAFTVARRAVRRCAPYLGLDPANYSNWRQIELTFDPRGMMGQ